jgi:hypothetical protein
LYEGNDPSPPLRFTLSPLIELTPLFSMRGFGESQRPSLRLSRWLGLPSGEG